MVGRCQEGWGEDNPKLALTISLNIEAQQCNAFGQLCCLFFQDVVLYFNARQQGKFQMCQKLDVLGYVARQRANNTTKDDAELRLGSFYTISLHLSAICKIEMTPPSPKLNPGKYHQLLECFG